MYQCPFSRRFAEFNNTTIDRSCPLPDPGGNCFCSIRDSREDDYGDISPYYVEHFGPYEAEDGNSEEEEEVSENEITTFNSIPPTGQSLIS